jgi:1-acyl-sn-glycerol-3-phosphate acyltransferase
MKGISSCTSDNAKSLNDIITYAKKSNYVVVLFVEGVRHNGSAVMKFPIEVCVSTLNLNYYYSYNMLL